MPLELNIRQLDQSDARLEGRLPAEDLDLDLRDEMTQAAGPLEYQIEAQKMAGSVLVQGRLRLKLNCQCVRCLKAFERDLVLEHWTALLPLEGEEKAVVAHDCVDLTPYVREDILLEFPQHPLCKPDCGGLPADSSARKERPGDTGPARHAKSAWAELDKLKLKLKN